MKVQFHRVKNEKSSKDAKAKAQEIYLKKLNAEVKEIEFQNLDDVFSVFTDTETGENRIYNESGSNNWTILFEGEHFDTLYGFDEVKDFFKERGYLLKMIDESTGDSINDAVLFNMHHIEHKYYGEGDYIEDDQVIECFHLFPKGLVNEVGMCLTPFLIRRGQSFELLDGWVQYKKRDIIELKSADDINKVVNKPAENRRDLLTIIPYGSYMKSGSTIEIIVDFSLYYELIIQ
jgi:hypothetical protein